MWDAAKSSRSLAKRSRCALKFETRCRISSRSELFRFTCGIRLGSTMARGMGGSTGMLKHYLLVFPKAQLDELLQ